VLGLIGKTISHYHVLDQIGQGGMSSVFRAVDLRDERVVAVKVLSPYIANEPRFRARFEREIKLLGRLQHPHIMPILDFGEADGLAFIVMPYVGTGTLADRLMKGPVDPAHGARIVEQLASALTAAHAAGVIHRDVKPSNILLDPLGNVLLSDFSFAHQVDASQNLTGSALIGTPAYMSPEQCRGEPIDARSDQYALAVVLYQMATGRLPFEADTPMATALKHVNEPLPRPRLVNPNLPEEIELVLVRALAKEPALRYESVGELNRAFQSALAVALDPARRARTRDSARTTATYNKYQNVRPAPQRRWYERTALMAALIIGVACPVSAAAAAILFPGMLSGNASAAAPDVQGTVDAIVAANLSRSDMSPDALQTAVYVAVIQTLVATGAPIDEPGVEEIVFGVPGEGTPTPAGLDLVFPTSAPTATHGAGRGAGGGQGSASATPTATTTPTPGASAAPSVTSAAPTATTSGFPMSDTPGAPTTTPSPQPTATQAPSPTLVPPTATSPPAPTATSGPGPSSECGPDIPPGQCKKTQTAAAGGG